MALRHPSGSLRRHPQPKLRGKRVVLRPLMPSDFDAWREVRVHNERWLLPWEPQRPASLPDPTRDRHAYEARCAARERERTTDHAYPFGLFLDTDAGLRLMGEINLNNVVRGALQSATVGYWVDQRHAGNGYVAEGVVAAMRYAFEQLSLHRLEICIVPRNTNSRRVMDKLDIREEGVAVRYLEIAGEWEDHVRYGITVEEWVLRRTQLVDNWLA
ncbi:MAG TPA: GNAT family protein [Ilumatobacter sp.]|nr:GNAT family protein [Ilumatobacter sp.]